MKKFSIQLGITGSILGILAGLVELSIGTQIRPWIGNKENPAILGVVTILLSSMALAAFIVVRKRKKQTNDRKLANFLGALLPAVICFTTVGRLWYLPGTLLMIAVTALAYEFWMIPQEKASSEITGGKWRLMAGIGSLIILFSIGLAFWKSTFGLFHAEILAMGDRIQIDVLPMDFVRRSVLSNGVLTSENVEVTPVMFIYLLLIIGAVLVLIASLTISRFFARMGGGITLLGLLLCLILLPTILAQVNYAPGYVNLLKSLGWGWHLSFIGMSLTLITNLFRIWPHSV